MVSQTGSTAHRSKYSKRDVPGEDPAQKYCRCLTAKYLGPCQLNHSTGGELQ